MQNKFKEAFQSKTFRAFLCGLGVAIVALAIFQAGMVVGFHKAKFSYKYGENYYRTFAPDQRKGMAGMMMRDTFPNSHGTIGKIVSINLPTIIVVGPDKIEKVVRITDKTSIEKFKESLTAADLKVDDFVVVIGSPNDTGEIEAKFVRLAPQPPEAMMQDSNNAFFKATSE